MSYFNQPQYKKIIGLLSLFNICLLAIIFFSFSKPKDRPRHDPISIFSKELQLSEAQDEQLKKIHQTHHKKLRSIKKIWRENKNAWMNALSETPSDKNKVEKYAELIGQNQVEIEKSIGEYFLQLKAICDESQKEKLNTLFLKAMHPPKHRKN